MWCMCLNLTSAEAQRCDKRERNGQHKEKFVFNLSVVWQKRTSLEFIVAFPLVALYSRCPFISVRIKYSPRSWCKCFEEFLFLCFKGLSCVRQVKWKLRSLFSPLTACKRNTFLPYTSQWELSNSPVRLWSDNSHCPKSLSLQRSLLQVYGLCGRSFVIKIALTSPPSLSSSSPFSPFATSPVSHFLFSLLLPASPPPVSQLPPLPVFVVSHSGIWLCGRSGVIDRDTGSHKHKHIQTHTNKHTLAHIYLYIYLSEI